MSPNKLKTLVPGGALDLSRLPDYRWLENGQSVFSGKLTTLYNRLDSMFFDWAEDWAAESFLFPTFIAARHLNKVQYFHSFPHLATFPVVLETDQANLKDFVSKSCERRDEHENKPGDSHDQCAAAPFTVNLTRTAPVQDVLTPAACYHFYPQLSGQALSSAKYLTTRATCYRREAYYEPLQRQWSFSMREIVCVGSEAEVKDFLTHMQIKMDSFFRKIGLEIKFENATDPFFNPAKNPKYLFQKVQPVKTEMVFQDKLAIGSFNFHRSHFGEAFAITNNGEPAHSGCVAFGLERWIYAYLCQFGLNEDFYRFE